MLDAHPRLIASKKSCCTMAMVLPIISAIVKGIIA
jgi:hypothetical protein